MRRRSRGRSISKICKITPKKNKIKCTTDSMAGHAGAFINITEPRHGSFCGKLVDDEDAVREYEFLKTITSNPKYKEWKPFIPTLYQYGRDTCYYDNKRYMIMENLLKNLKGTANFGGKIKYLDIKLGQYTADPNEQLFLRNKGYKSTITKYFKHMYIDSSSTSTDLGFRIEGLNFPVGNKRYKKGSITTTREFFNINTSSVIKTFLPKKIKLQKQIIEKLILLLKLYIKKTDQWASIGSSIFIAHDENKIVVKMIDFAHAYFYNDCSDQKCRNVVSGAFVNTLFGMKNFLDFITSESEVDIDIEKIMKKSENLLNERIEDLF